MRHTPKACSHHEGKVGFLPFMHSLLPIPQNVVHQSFAAVFLVVHLLSCFPHLLFSPSLSLRFLSICYNEMSQPSVILLDREIEIEREQRGSHDHDLPIRDGNGGRASPYAVSVARESIRPSLKGCFNEYYLRS